MKIAPKLILPDDAVTQTYAYIGRKGSGKTYAAGKFAELLLAAHVQVVVLDPVGNWYGLRLDKTGRKPSGLKIPILGGEHGDVPLEHTAGKIVADFIVSTGSSAVLDVSAFRKAGRKTFVTAFAEELFHRKKSNRTPMHFILEESQVFAPEQSSGQTTMLGAIEDIVRLGRNYGIGCSMITQRPQSVNKEVLNQAEPLIAFQLVGSHERDAVKKWVKHAGADVDLDALPSLDIGECLFWSPAWLRTFVRTKFYPKRTFDASATPKLGETLPVPQKLKPVDLDVLKLTMADTIERAKADDPKELHKQIAELNRQLKSSKPVVDQSAIDRAIKERDALWSKRADEVHFTITEQSKSLAEMGNTLMGSIEQAEIAIRDALHDRLVGYEPPKPTISKITPTPQILARPARRSVPAQPTTNGELTAYQSDMLRVLIDRHPIATPKSMLATLAKKSARSSVFMPNLNTLIGLAYAERSDGKYIATESGLHALPGYEPAPPSGADALNHWLQTLPAYESSLLKVLADKWPQSLSYEEISESSGKSQGSSMFRPALRNLVKSVFAVQSTEGFTAADVFFEGASP